MDLRFKKLTGLVVLVAAAIGFPSTATAQPDSRTTLPGLPAFEQPRYVDETLYIDEEIFNRVFFTNEPGFFRNGSLKEQLDLILGLDSFPEDKIAEDARLIHILYEDTLEQQVSSDPIIRTPDLPNPYNTSILFYPGFNVNDAVEGIEATEPTEEFTEPTEEFTEPTFEEPPQPPQ